MRYHNIYADSNYDPISIVFLIRYSKLIPKLSLNGYGYITAHLNMSSVILVPCFSSLQRQFLILLANENTLNTFLGCPIYANRWSAHKELYSTSYPMSSYLLTISVLPRFNEMLHHKYLTDVSSAFWATRISCIYQQNGIDKSFYMSPVACLYLF